MGKGIQFYVHFGMIYLESLDLAHGHHNKKLN